MQILARGELRVAGAVTDGAVELINRIGAPFAERPLRSELRRRGHSYNGYRAQRARRPDNDNKASIPTVRELDRTRFDFDVLIFGQLAAFAQPRHSICQSPHRTAAVVLAHRLREKTLTVIRVHVGTLLRNGDDI